LIRSGYTTLNPESPWKDLTEYLWPVLEGIIKTNIENKQNIIIEGSYIPYDYKKYFNEDYLKEIKIVYLIFSEKYIHTNFDLIDKKSSIIENRISDNLNKEELILNANVIKRECKKHGIDYILIDENYDLSEIMDQVDCKL
jgi:2-phosphoglycerate kinase